MTRHAAIALRASLVTFAVLLVVDVRAEQDGFEEPAMGRSESPDAELAGSENPDALEATSANPDSLLTGSSDPDSHLAGSEDPDALDAQAGEVADQETGSEALQDLPDAETLDTEVKQRDAADVAGSDSQQLGDEIQSVEAAKQDLASAKQRADELDHAYDDMIRRDYPRGEERQKLIDERQAAHQQLEMVQKRYDALLGGAGGGPASGQW